MTQSATTADVNAPWRSVLGRDEIGELLEMNDLRTWGSIALNWGIVFAVMALVAQVPHVLTVLLALFVIGARQLGFAVMMHETSHSTLLTNKKLNDFVGNWVCSYPIWSDPAPYRAYHLQHHARTGSDEDPDLALVLPFPITRASFGRKAWRDLSGQTGIKFARAAFRRTFGRFNEDSVARKAAIGVAVTNAVLLGILALAGHPELYLLWVVAWLTTNTFVTRLRSIAEHALTPDRVDPLRNTRTVRARWWERLLLAPNRVNYHLEHHLLMTVPHYNLPRMHALLRERGALDNACIADGYWGVIKKSISKPEAGEREDATDQADGLAHINGL
jgi:fatty acid desaturase